MFYITVDDEITLHLVQEHHHPEIFNLIESNRTYLEEHTGELDTTPEETRARSLLAKEMFATTGSLVMLIRHQGKTAGMINLHNREGGTVSGAEIGYWLAQDLSGKGIVTRATKTLTDYAFTHWDTNRVFLGIATNNPRSYAIPERLGFTLEGTLRQNTIIDHGWIDHRIYALLKDDWTSPQQPPILRYPVHDTVALRMIENRHADELFALCDRNRDHIGQWLPWIADTNSVDDTQGFIESSLKQYGKNNGFQAGIWHDHQLVGMIGYLEWNFIDKQTEIGYWLSADATGKGIITRCTRALVDYAFHTLKLNRVVIRCAVGNEKSCAVARRLGFQHECVQRQASWLYDRFIDMNVYTILAEEWETS